MSIFERIASQWELIKFSRDCDESYCNVIDLYQYRTRSVSRIERVYFVLFHRNLSESFVIRVIRIVIEHILNLFYSKS